MKELVPDHFKAKLDILKTLEIGKCRPGAMKLPKNPPNLAYPHYRLPATVGDVGGSTATERPNFVDDRCLHPEQSDSLIIQLNSP